MLPQEGTLANIKSEADFDLWVQGKPREVSATLAARAALRSLPLLQRATAPKRTGKELVNIALPLFRGAAISWVIAKYGLDNSDLNATYEASSVEAAISTYSVISAHSEAVALEISAVADAIAAAQAAARATDATVYARRAVLRGAHAATQAGRFHGIITRPDRGASFPGASGVARLQQASSIGIAAGRIAEADFWSSISTDAAHIDQGAAASIIAGSPLWPQSQPDWVPLFWQDLKAELHASNQDWFVWTAWYDDRLAGHPRSQGRELIYAQIENALWRQGPAEVNAEIVRRIEALEPPPLHELLRTLDDATAKGASEDLMPPPLPEQVPTATTFRTNSEGLIDVVPDPPSPEAVTDTLQRELYEETRFKADRLIQLGHNQLGDLSIPAQRFHDSLKERIENLSITTSWSRGNTLRSRLKAHDLSMANVEPDAARLPPFVAEALRDLIHTWNVFIVGDPKGSELDEGRLGPAEFDAAKKQIAAAASIVEAVRHADSIVTAAAIEAVVEQNSAGISAMPGINGDQAIDLSRKTTGNFVIQILRAACVLLGNESSFAWKELRAGVYRAPGTTVATLAISSHSSQIASFIAQNSEALKQFVEVTWHNPALVEIVGAIARTLN
ncbi:hypothetical protein [Methylocella tundrae]|uniref:hypothetical protein n=1 Tax=Methylocella tundrae TaxID=227605 RepID=UPI00157A6783|nr:hypothetical protein [Methylocella tundrae]